MGSAGATEVLEIEGNCFTEVMRLCTRQKAASFLLSFLSYQDGLEIDGT